MIFTPLPLAGAYLIDPEPALDERGHFSRVWCRDEFARQGLDPGLAQASVSFSHRRGTLRGLHFQTAPHEEVKIVRCTRGAIFDVIVDLRPGSPTFRGWHGEILDAANGRQIYVPKGFAHGLLTLADESEVSYLISTPYVPEAVAGIRWDDPAISIRWPEPPVVISDRDRSFPDFRWSER